MMSPTFELDSEVLPESDSLFSYLKFILQENSYNSKAIDAEILTRGHGPEDAMKILHNCGALANHHKLTEDFNNEINIIEPFLAYVDGDYKLLLSLKGGKATIATSSGVIKEKITNPITDIVVVSKNAELYKKAMSKEYSWFDLFKEVKPDLWSMVSVILILQVFSLFIPTMSYFFLDIAVPSTTLSLVNMVGVLFLSLIIYMGIFAYAQSKLAISIDAKLKYRLSHALFKKLFSVDIKELKERSSLHFKQHFESLSELEAFISQGAVTTLFSSLTLTLSLVGISVIFPVFGLPLLFIFFIALMYTIRKSKRLSYLSQEGLGIERDMENSYVETIEKIVPITSNNKRSMFLKRLNDSTIKKLRNDTESEEIEESILWASTVANQTAFVVTFILSIYLIQNGGFTIGMVFSLVLFQSIVFKSADRFLSSVKEIVKISPFFDNVKAFFMMNSEVDNVGGFFPSIMQDTCISVENLYHQIGDNVIFNNASFSFSKNKYTVITGKSGAGKSTLLDIISGFTKPDRGVLKYNGIDVSEIGLIKYRQRLSIVLQKQTTLQASILNNITLFDEDYDRERLLWSLDLVELSAFIDSLKMKENTILGDISTGLSGGQMQRLAIARALYKKSEILILDESTSDLDLGLEKRIIERLKENNLTVISVAHREENIRQADKIITL